MLSARVTCFATAGTGGTTGRSGALLVVWVSMSSTVAPAPNATFGRSRHSLLGEVQIPCSGFPPLPASPAPLTHSPKSAPDGSAILGGLMKLFSQFIRARMAPAVALLVLAALAAPASAAAATRYASPSGTNLDDCLTVMTACDLASALTAASNGDEIVVETGTYAIASNITAGAGNLNVHGVAGQPRPVLNVGASMELAVGTANLSYLDIERSGGSGDLINDDGGNINRVLMSGDASGGILCQCYDGTITNSVMVDTGASGAAAGLNSNGGSGTEAYYNDTFYATQAGGAAIELLEQNASTMLPAVETYSGTNVIAFNAAGGHDVAIHSDQLAMNAVSTATLTLTHSAYQNPLVDPIGGGTATVIDGGGNTSASPVFVNPGAGDFHELASSPTVGTGTTNASTDGTADFNGLARSVLGLTDIGAFQYQPLTASAAASAPTPLVGSAVTFTATVTDPNPGPSVLAYHWHFDDGGQASGSVVNHTFTTPGVHHASLTVSDASPYAAATASATVTAEPGISGASVSVSKLPSAKHKKHAKKKPAQYQAKLSFVLTNAATVSGTLVRTPLGKRVNGRCASALHLAATRKRRCSVTPISSAISLPGVAGSNAVALAAGAALPAGHYSITLTAVNGAERSTPVTVTFIVP